MLKDKNFLSAENVANEFVNDFISDLNEQLSKQTYLFDNNWLADDKDLSIVKSKLEKLGFTLTKVKDKDNEFSVSFTKQIH